MTMISMEDTGGFATLLSDRDALIMRLATEEGLTDQRKIAQKIAQLGYGTISATRVGQILRAKSGRDRVKAFLDAHANEEFSANQIARELGVDVNRVSYVVDAMAKKGLVAYTVGQTDSNHRTLENIHLTKRERARVARLGNRPIIDRKAPKEVEQPIVVEAEPEEAVLPEPEPEPEPIPAHDIPRYPLINKLLEREADLIEAAKLLERHGLDDLALSAMAKVDDFTPFEREVIAFVRERTNG